MFVVLHKIVGKVRENKRSEQIERYISVVSYGRTDTLLDIFL